MQEGSVSQEAFISGQSSDVRPPPFYVVAPVKFYMLMVGTFGMYTIAWFYWHFRRQKEFYKDGTIPVLRSIFVIFFTHSLFIELAHHQKKTGDASKWHPVFWASLFVVINLLGSLMDIMTRQEVQVPYATLYPIVWIVGTMICLGKAQTVANRVCGDPAGSTNVTFSAVNFVFMLIGTLVLLAYMLGLVVMVFSGMPI